MVLVPASALGATTIGETFVPTADCSTFNTYVQAGSVGNQYEVPSDGVITSWSHEAGATGPSLKFKVHRPTGGNNFSLVGESELTATVANQLNSFDTRIPVTSGDLIGMFLAPAESFPTCALLTPGIAQNEVGFFIGDTAVGDNLFTVGPPEGKLDISARLEPDADGDGFGDETQDQCPDDPSTQGACALPARIGKVKVTGPSRLKKGKKATYKVKISNTGGLPASGVKVKVTGKGVKATASAGRIAAGKSKTVKVKLKPKKAGKTTLKFKVTSAKAGGKRIRKSVTIR